MAGRHGRLCRWGGSTGLTAGGVTGGQAYVFGAKGAGFSFTIRQPASQEEVTTGTAEQINAAYFSDALTGYIATENGGVRRTTDGGETWTASNTGVGNNINAIRTVGPVAFLAGADTSAVPLATPEPATNSAAKSVPKLTASPQPPTG